MENKSEHIKRPLYTSCPRNVSIPQNHYWIDYQHFSQDIQKLKNFINIIFCSSHCVFCYSDTVDSYSKISSTSPHTELLAFPRFNIVASYTLTWIQTMLLTLVFYYFCLSTVTFACDNFSTTFLLSPTGIHHVFHNTQCGQLSTSILVSLLRALFNVSLHMHRT